MKDKRKKKVEEVLKRAFPQGTDKVKGPLRELIEMLRKGE